MSRKNQIYEVFVQQSNEHGFTANDIAKKLNLDRANVSSDLNKLVKEGLLDKSNSRPVVFKIKSKNGINQYSNPKVQNVKFSFENEHESFYEENISLRPAIEKARSAILYPPHGMHTLILGETGVGKSAFAAKMHQFAIRSNILCEDSPFIIFNCADYANNPQLLLGQLFGVKKGAYTGAIEQKGLLEKANNGILFLDEVHRLSPEGQEMLFTFIDYKLYRRLGETENERTSNVLIISATTEDPDSTLLSTFTRRIPMVIKLPALSDRTYEERFTLIKRFFTEESLRLGKEIIVSANSIRSFLFYPCQNNIGQLKADIQLACAKAYADYITNQNDKIRIYSTDLNWYVKEGLFIEKKVKHSITLLNEHFEFSPTKGISIPQMDDTDTIYDRIDTKYEQLMQRGVAQDELSLLMENDIESYFTHYLSSINRKLSSKENVQKIIQPEIVALSEKLLKVAGEKLNKKFNEKILVALSLHIQTLLQRIQSNKKIYHPNITQIRDQYKNEFSIAIECVKMIEDFADISIPFDEVAFITMFFVYGNENFKEQNSNIKVIVLAHGNGIAREMANVTNELLENNEVIGIDMPLSEPPQDFLNRVKDYIKSLGKLNGILLCIDMGSLAYIGDIIEAECEIPVRVIQMVSTAHVIEASRKATLGYSLDELYQDVRNLTTFFIHSHSKNKQQQTEFYRSVILTACLTGHGSAIAIKNILTNNLVYDKEMIEIVPISLLNKEELQKMLKDITKERNIVCIVSNFDIDVPYNTFHLQDVLNMKAAKTIQELISYEETYLKMADTLQETISLKNAKNVINVIRRSLNDIQLETGRFFKNEDLMGIVLHMSCMINRIQNGEPLTQFKNKEDKINNHYMLYLKMKKILHQIEEACDIIIPDDEICYLLEFYSRSE
jgi:transcriptional regulatory protein LevR/transcriptional regulator with AAA-type ATPase domain